MKETAVPKSKAKTAYALLSEVRRLILAEPLRYSQHRFIIRKDGEENPPAGFPSCGTVGCVAGWVATLKGPQHFGYTETQEIARNILGLDYEDTHDLFNGGAIGYEPQTKAHAKAGAAHIAAFQKKYRAQLLAKKV